MFRKSWFEASSWKRITELHVKYRERNLRSAMRKNCFGSEENYIFVSGCATDRIKNKKKFIYFVFIKYYPSCLVYIYFLFVLLPEIFGMFVLAIIIIY